MSDRSSLTRENADETRDSPGAIDPVVGTMLVTEVGFLQEIFHTVSLNADQWGWCLLPGPILLILAEIHKAITRATHQHTSSAGHS